MNNALFPKPSKQEMHLPNGTLCVIALSEWSVNEILKQTTHSPKWTEPIWVSKKGFPWLGMQNTILPHASVSEPVLCLLMVLGAFPFTR